MKQGKKWLFAAAFVLLLAVFLFAGWQLLGYWLEGDEAATQHEQLIEQAVTAPLPPEQPPEEERTPEYMDTEVTEILDKPRDLPPIRVDFDALWEINTDVIAWLYSEGTEISYPVVQATDNEYYLRRLLDGSYNRSGTIFADYRNSGDFSDWHTLVYGHNMKNSTMFGTFPNYASQEYYEAHPVLYLLTPEKNFRVELLAGYLTDPADEIYTFADSRAQRDELVGMAVGKSDFTASVDIGTEDKLVTFSTCAYNTEDARYILVGVLKEIDFE